ncbi:hypothetical protein, partial [Pseudomonas syringae group genomosp. 7]|uniref:hypothetical protein n=1 Tax=Pseudomonas syringae group genomosp. 7 TaxID=251699 RepID=UPI00376FDE54
LLGLWVLFCCGWWGFFVLFGVLFWVWLWGVLLACVCWVLFWCGLVGGWCVLVGVVLGLLLVLGGVFFVWGGFLWGRMVLLGRDWFCCWGCVCCCWVLWVLWCVFVLCFGVVCGVVWWCVVGVWLVVCFVVFVWWGWFGVCLVVFFLCGWCCLVFGFFGGLVGVVVCWGCW